MIPPLTILFATTTGNAEDCAGRTAKKLEAAGHAPHLSNLRDYSPDKLRQCGIVLLIASTWGDGEPPDDAVPFWEALQNLSSGALIGVNFAVLALGDSSYEQFCGFGRQCDEAFERLGGQRLHPRLDCDNNHEELIDGWIDQISAKISAMPSASSILSS